MRDAGDENSDLMTEIRAFCESFGIAESTFGRHAVNDGKFVSRIAQGSWITDETESRVRAFMARARAGEIALRGRPRRKKDTSRAETMEQLISTETSVRTAGSFAYAEQRHRLHVFSNTTNEPWVLADRAAAEMADIAPRDGAFRLFYAPMDNGIAITRMLRALSALHPGLPILVVMKGRGMEDLRNTLGRLVDRLAEHPNMVIAVTNMHYWEAIGLQKHGERGKPLAWHDVALSGQHSYDFQTQVSRLFETVSAEWVVEATEKGNPGYVSPSVAVVYRKDARDAVARILPGREGGGLSYDYVLLNHPYLHTHTMVFRTDYVLGPVARLLAPGGRMTVVTSLGDDPAHEIVRRLWPDQSLPTTSRHDVISAMRKALPRGRYSFSGLTDRNAIFRFDMHTLPIAAGRPMGALSLNSAWNNAVYFAQVREDLAQEAMRQGGAYLDTTREVIEAQGGLWFVNESFSISRLP